MFLVTCGNNKLKRNKNKNKEINNLMLHFSTTVSIGHGFNAKKAHSKYSHDILILKSTLVKIYFVYFSEDSKIDGYYLRCYPGSFVLQVKFIDLKWDLRKKEQFKRVVDKDNIKYFICIVSTNSLFFESHWPAQKLKTAFQLNIKWFQLQ